MQYSFHHSSFYLCSILFITPASTYAVFFPSLQLLFIHFSLHQSSFCMPTQYSFHHSNFYLCSILLITPTLGANISIVSMISIGAFYLCSILFITPASIYIVFFWEVLSNTIVAEMFVSCGAVFTRSSNYQARVTNKRRSFEELKSFVCSLQSFKSFPTKYPSYQLVIYL